MSAKDQSADIEQLIAEFEKSGLRELHVIRDGFEIYLSTDPDTGGIGAQVTPVAPPAVAVAAAAAAPAAPPAAEGLASAPAGDWPADAVVVAAPYLGTFYRAPKPGADPYVEAGDPVTAETEICLVEVMKLFTSVRAGCDGHVHAILAADGALVEADQPLFVIVKD
ncbi:acetyl-CoA carboxylase biotin carboxyl carrier protein [Sphingopyxis sp. NJF-3]